ncbi:hypothetical protein AYM40_25905 [Paraburkholderia phytofirmans OLGA172]|uniref:Uncharacterized protein n=1 Tax=Paraburkholderia phytofirmans OLGA172 TaxID=1417228 RepID=A0A160FS88_9BURK|nr:hypothetical protein AYM40_25905 [Paraburkholderia phytofirmans OLGA172]
MNARVMRANAIACTRLVYRRHKTRPRVISMRDRGQLQKEVLQHRDPMRKLLITFGCWDEVDQPESRGRSTDSMRHPTSSLIR